MIRKRRRRTGPDGGVGPDGMAIDEDENLIVCHIGLGSLWVFSALGEPLYRIKAELMEQSIDAYGKREPLQAGMQVEADIRLDRRRLIEWIFEPVLSLAGRA